MFARDTVASLVGERSSRSWRRSPRARRRPGEHRICRCDRGLADRQQLRARRRHRVGGRGAAQHRADRRPRQHPAASAATAAERRRLRRRGANSTTVHDVSLVYRSRSMRPGSANGVGRSRHPVEASSRIANTGLQQRRSRPLIVPDTSNRRRVEHDDATAPASIGRATSMSGEHARGWRALTVADRPRITWISLRPRARRAHPAGGAASSAVPPQPPRCRRRQRHRPASATSSSPLRIMRKIKSEGTLTNPLTISAGRPPHRHAAGQLARRRSSLVNTRRKHRVRRPSSCRAARAGVNSGVARLTAQGRREDPDGCDRGRRADRRHRRSRRRRRRGRGRRGDPSPTPTGSAAPTIAAEARPSSSSPRRSPVSRRPSRPATNGNTSSRSTGGRRRTPRAGRRTRRRARR